MNSVPIRILHLEDDPLDADLVREYLRADGLDFVIERVWARDDFIAALDRGHDLILADHQLPSFDGEAALEIARSRAPHIPFIFVSGTLGEDVAVEALRHGATDYVVKQRMDRLPSVVRRALAEVDERMERQRTEAALKLSEGSFDTFANAAPLLCWTADASGSIDWYNQRWYDYTGMEPGQMQGWDWHPVHDPAVLPKVMESWKAAIAAGEPYEMIFPLRGADGTFRTFLTRAAPVKDERGQVLRWVGTNVDVSAQYDAEAALREESKALEILNRVAGEIAAELDLEKLVQTVVDAGVQLAGAEFGAFFYNVLDGDGASYMLYALSGAERSAFESFPMPRATELFGPTFRGEGMIRLDDVLADPRYGLSAPFHGMPKGHLPVRSYLTAPVTMRSGEVVGALFFGHGEVAMFSDRDERLIAGLAAQAAVGIENARLFQSAQRLNQTLETQVAERTAERDRIWQVSEDLLGVADKDGVWRSVNPAWIRVLGWEPDEIVGRTSEWLEHPDDRAKTRAEVRSLAAGYITTSFENRLRTRTGSYRTLSWRAVPADTSIYCVARDITAQVEQESALAETEERLRQAQKMETLGQLTGGVAHDFNNLLQIVMGNLDLLKRHLPDDPPRLRRAADSAYAGAERAATLTQRLLAFSRRQPLAPSAVDPGRLLAGMSDLFHRTIGEQIEVRIRLASENWMVEVDANQLEGALLNLAVNARDAMPSGGVLAIAIANVTLDTPLKAQSGEVRPGDHVAISVKDDGTGMAPEVLGRVFEPFFTTKDVGKGTGLGLSMVYGFVKQSGGHVRIESEQGQGTEVILYLPRFIPPAAPEPKHVAKNEELRGGRETILVCEDDDGVRAYSADSLRELGYTVLEARDAASALDYLGTHRGAIDLLFTDIVLPGGMMGSDLAVRAREMSEGLRILFTTGYARDTIVHHGRLDEGIDLLLKPFSFDDLAARVRTVLDR